MQNLKQLRAVHVNCSSNVGSCIFWFSCLNTVETHPRHAGSSLRHGWRVSRNVRNGLVSCLGALNKQIFQIIFTDSCKSEGSKEKLLKIKFLSNLKQERLSEDDGNDNSIMTAVPSTLKR